jgi:hypothetical protein
MQLINDNGSLALPPDPESGEARLLLHFYPAGDCDTIPWPMESPYRDLPTLQHHLARALFDASECEGTPLQALLPDGTSFDAELHLS